MHDLHVMNNREMNYRLTRFMHEVRRQDGKPYPPSTMQQIVACLQRSVREYHSVAGHLTTVNFRRTTLSLVCSGLHLYCLFFASHLDKPVATGSYTARFIDRSICSGSGLCHLL